jgi:S1-C subfamily serine protease
MLKTHFVLPLFLVLITVVSITAQSTGNVKIKVVVVNKSLELKNVPKYPLIVRSVDDASFGERKVSTDVSGVVMISLPAGNYSVSSVAPLTFEDRSFSWEQRFTAAMGTNTSVELSNDNASISTSASGSADAGARRRVNEIGVLFRTLRDGVVTIEGELGSATGFIVDEKGLVVTNYHAIAESNEIRVRFDKQTAVRARVLAKDEDRDLAILQINLSAFPGSRVLRLAKDNTAEPAVIEGEQVFSIGSPLQQDKILTTGIVSKLDQKAIISDISFNSGSSGSPLFNSLGEVVGVVSFDLKGKSQFDPKGQNSAGLAGIIRIEECAELIDMARQEAAKKGTPSAELMPNLPDGTFPVDTIRKAIASKDFPVKEYISDVKNYEIKFMTPVYKFYAIEKDRIDSLKEREKRNKAKASADMFRDLNMYSEYAGELVPVVDILALPETAPTGKSLLLSAATNLTIGYSTPFDLKYKADFYSMKLTCDGKEITPLRRTKTEIDRSLQNYYKTKRRYTYAGIYSYPYELFAPGRCGEIKVQVFSEEDIEEPITTVVSDAVRNRIWTDFQEFRERGKQ